MWAAFTPIGYLVARFFWFFPAHVASTVHILLWWTHALTVFVFIALIPYTKFFHFVAGAANLYFRRSPRPIGALSSPGDIGMTRQTVWGGLDAPFGLMSAIKQQFDPEDRLNPGRFVYQ